LGDLPVYLIIVSS